VALISGFWGVDGLALALPVIPELTITVNVDAVAGSAMRKPPARSIHCARKLRPFIETRDLLWSVQELFRRSDRAEERLRLVLEADLR
jgi:hypothetical protein